MEDDLLPHPLSHQLRLTGTVGIGDFDFQVMNLALAIAFGMLLGLVLIELIQVILVMILFCVCWLIALPFRLVGLLVTNEKSGNARSQDKASSWSSDTSGTLF